MAGEPGDSMGLVHDSIAIHLSADVFHVFGRGGWRHSLVCAAMGIPMCPSTASVFLGVVPSRTSGASFKHPNPRTEVRCWFSLGKLHKCAAVILTTNKVCRKTGEKENPTQTETNGLPAHSLSSCGN